MKIICIGRNYAEHAAELENKIPDEPIIFLKPSTALLAKGQPFTIPSWTKEVHHEIEVVVEINREGCNISEAEAELFYDKVSVGIDFTARDVQSKLKSNGHPWERAKGFDGSALVGDFLPIDELKAPLQDLRFRLCRNGAMAQDGHTADMIFSVGAIIAEVSTFITLEPGDLLFTGTPAGVAKVASGDLLEGSLEDRKLFELSIQ